MALAEPDETPKALYASGEFEKAARAAQQVGGADNLALAAKSLSSLAVLTNTSQDVVALTPRIRSLALEALSEDPLNAEAQLQLAIAIWFDGRRVGALESYVRGLPNQGRKHIVQAMNAAPDGSIEQAWAHALLGAWHLEVLRRGGSRGAAIYGADLHEGAEHFNRAIALAPGEVAIAVQCAISYLALDAETYSEHARIALEYAVAADAETMFEQQMQVTAALLQSALHEKDLQTIDQVVNELVGPIDD